MIFVLSSIKKIFPNKLVYVFVFIKNIQFHRCCIYHLVRQMHCHIGLTEWKIVYNKMDI